MNRAIETADYSRDSHWTRRIRNYQIRSSEFVLFLVQRHHALTGLRQPGRELVALKQRPIVSMHRLRQFRGNIVRQVDQIADRLHPQRGQAKLQP